MFKYWKDLDIKENFGQKQVASVPEQRYLIILNI